MANQTNQDLAQLRDLEKELSLLRQVNAAELDRMNQSIGGQLSGLLKIREAESAIADQQRNLNQLAEKLQRIRQAEGDQLKGLSNEDRNRVLQQERYVNQQQQELGIRREQLGYMRSQVSTSKALVGSMGDLADKGAQFLTGVLALMPIYLAQTDGLLRSVARQTGMGEQNMARMRDSLVESGIAAARLGATTKELSEAQGAYLEATGRLRIMSGESLVNIAAMAEGTNLGYAGAAKLAASFAEIGYGIGDTKKFTEGLVNDTEAMGLNSGKVLENISGMIGQASTFSFQGGMGKGLEQMAQQAEKLKVSIQGTFAAADKARTLEGSLNMASQLMVLGGNFAKADPFQLSFLARNDPAKFQVALADMTKGMASFNSQTGEIAVSAYNMDRLRAAAEATGQPLEDLVKSARNAAQISQMSNQLFVGTKEQREAVMMMSQLGRDGKATITLDGSNIDLNKLTQTQLNMVLSEKKTLEERAKQAQDFDKAFGVFANELKATALPLLNTLNSGMKIFQNVLDTLGTTGLRFTMGLSAGALLLSKGLALTTGRGLMTRAVDSVKDRFFSSAASGAVQSVTGGAAQSAVGSAASAGGSAAKGLTSMSGAATMAAVGVAAVGIGYGFKLAAEGASLFAMSLKGLNAEQLDAMKMGLLGIGVGLGGIVLVAAGLAASGAGPAAVLMLLGIGAAVTTIGFGVKLATDGIGNMMTSIGSLENVNLDGLGNFFSKVSGFMSGDVSNLAALVASVFALNAMSSNNENGFMKKIDELMSTPLKLDTANATFVANIDVVTNLDGERLVNKFAKRFNAKILQAVKGAGSL